MAYLDTDAFALRSQMPSKHIEDIEDAYPGWVEQQLETWSRWIDSRLVKRYAVPFEEPVPETIKIWLTSIVTLQAYLRMGIDPNDLDIEIVRSDRERTLDEVREAADAEHGLFDLPLRQDTSKSGIVKGAPRSYSEASPYVWTDVQARVGRGEDRSRGGSYG